MARYTLRRLLQLIGVVWGAVTLVFVLFFLLPSDPARLMAGGDVKNPDPAVVANIEARYGLDRPVLEQYASYMGSLVTGDFGTSFRGNEEVTEIISAKAPASIRLAVWAVLVETLAGIGIGMLSTRRRGRGAEAAMSASTAIVAATPVFVLAFVLQQVTGVYAAQHDWFSWAQLPVRGIGPDSWYLVVIPSGEQLRYLVQPVAVVAVVSVMVIAKLTRTSMADVDAEPYIRTARAKGLTERAALRRHGMRNALAPVVTFIGIDFGLIIGSAVIAEQVFSWPGLGTELVEATNARDLPVMVALTAVVVIVYGVVTMGADLLTAWMDPRVRDELRAA